MERIERLKRLGWFLPLRLASYVIIITAVAFWLQYPDYLHSWVILYSLVTLGFAVTIAMGRRADLERTTQFLIATQFVLEIAIESGIIFSTGNANSPFSGLFLLTIVSAALAYRLVGTLAIASLSSVGYAFVVWLSHSRTEENMQGQPALVGSSVQDFVFYSIVIHLLIFFLVAFIAGYLAERLSSQDKKLADTSRALRQARLETDDILRHLNSGLLTVDSMGYVIYFNRAAEKILGYREDEVRGMHCEEAFADRMPNLAQALMEGVQHGFPNPRKEIDILDGQRRSVPLGLSTSTLSEDGHGFRGVIAIFSDLTEAKALEAKVRSADRLAAIGELSASIAHEIRNPLAAISGSVEILQRELTLSEQNGRLMALILKESNRLNKILTDFLTYARLDRPTYNKVELCHIINEVIELLRHHSAVTGQTRINFHSSEAICYVVGDGDLIRQLLMNLTINACESFGDHGGEVRIQLTRIQDGRSVLLEVSDNGPGIPHDHLDRIFQPFYSTKKHGTGLGLAIVHRICTALKLPLGVDSQAGIGTSFSIEFQSFQSERSSSTLSTGHHTVSTC